MSINYSNFEVDINCADTFGCTALHCAMIHGNLEGVQMLLARPDLESINQKSKNGETPLMLAVAYNKVDCVEAMLADLRVNLDIKGGPERTSEQVAKWGKFKSVSKLKSLNPGLQWSSSAKW